MSIRIENRENFRVILTEYFDGKLEKAKFFMLSEAQQDDVLSELESHCIHPQWMDYIFHSDEYVNDDGMYIDKIVDTVFSYKPIEL